MTFVMPQESGRRYQVVLPSTFLDVDVDAFIIAELTDILQMA